MLCSLVEVHQHFRWTDCIHLQDHRVCYASITKKQAALPLGLPLRWRQNVPSKYWWTSQRVHSITTQNTVLSAVTAVRTWCPVFSFTKTRTQLWTFWTWITSRKSITINIPLSLTFRSYLLRYFFLKEFKWLQQRQILKKTSGTISSISVYKWTILSINNHLILAITWKINCTFSYEQTKKSHSTKHAKYNTETSTETSKLNSKLIRTTSNHHYNCFD
jgi:hypothetical protein